MTDPAGSNTAKNTSVTPVHAAEFSQAGAVDVWYSEDGHSREVEESDILAGSCDLASTLNWGYNPTYSLPN